MLRTFFVIDIHLRNLLFRTVELVWTQLLQGIGSGLIAGPTEIGAQAFVPHNNVAMATAIYFLFVFTGSSVGSAIGEHFLVLAMEFKFSQR